jgi:hypothetical protein
MCNRVGGESSERKLTGRKRQKRRPGLEANARASGKVDDLTGNRLAKQIASGGVRRSKHPATFGLGKLGGATADDGRDGTADADRAVATGKTVLGAKPANFGPGVCVTIDDVAGAHRSEPGVHVAAADPLVADGGGTCRVENVVLLIRGRPSRAVGFRPLSLLSREVFDFLHKRLTLFIQFLECLNSFHSHFLRFRRFIFDTSSST